MSSKGDKEEIKMMGILLVLFLSPGGLPFAERSTAIEAKPQRSAG